MPEAYHPATAGERRYMDKTLDSIVFDNRAEIGAVIHALEDWEESHPHSKDRETIIRMIRLLDAIEMSW